MIYPVSEKVCKKCPVCWLVEKDVSGRYLEEEEIYYQCLSGMESECRDMEDECREEN